jgi:hypothetical protein
MIEATDVVPARAASAFDLCATNDGHSNVSGECERPYSINGNGSYSPVDNWGQDICCDVLQQWVRVYLGAVNAQASWPFKPGSGFNTIYNGNSVWAFYIPADQPTGCIGSGGNSSPASGNNGVWPEGCTYGSGDRSQFWVWTTSGALINVGQTNYWGSPQYLYPGSKYQNSITWNPFGTQTGVPTFTWRAGS